MAYRQLPYVLLYLINAFSNTLKVCFGIKIIEAKMKKKKKVSLPTIKLPRRLTQDCHLNPYGFGHLKMDSLLPLSIIGCACFLPIKSSKYNRIKVNILKI